MRFVTNTIIVFVKTLIVIPVIAYPEIFRTIVVIAMTTVTDVGQVAFKDIVGHVVMTGFTIEKDADTVIGKTVAANLNRAVRLKGRQIGTDTNAAVNNLIVFNDGAGGFLEAYAHSGCAGGVRDNVVTRDTTLGVHEIDAYCVIVKGISLNDVVIGKHEMDGITATAAKIVAEGIFV